MTTALKARKSDGKDRCIVLWRLGTVLCSCARWCFCMDGSSVHIKTPLGKAMAKQGKHFAEKWCVTKMSTCINLPYVPEWKKRLQRQWYGMLKENALLGNFQHAPQTHYKCLPMKLKCFWYVVKIWRLPKVFSSVWNTTVRGDESYCIATKLFRWKKAIQWLKELDKSPNSLHHFSASLNGWRG